MLSLEQAVHFKDSSLQYAHRKGSAAVLSIMLEILMWDLKLVLVSDLKYNLFLPLF